jgi:DNA-binding NarL/FixJ family response regulator
MSTSPYQTLNRTLPRIAICEDNLPLRKEFEALILESGRYELVASSAYGLDIMDLLGKVKIDILLLDLQLPDIHGTEVLKHQHRVQPQCQALIVTMFGDEVSVLNAIEAGATGYVLKDEPASRLLEAIDELLGGGSPITPSVARLLLRHLQLAPAPVEPRLVTGTWDESLPARLQFQWSQREDEVLSYVAKGYSVQEVADLLNLSVNTIKTHVRRIYKKLAVNSRSEALHEARALGLLDRTAAGAVRPRPQP